MFTLIFSLNMCLAFVRLFVCLNESIYLKNRIEVLPPKMFLFFWKSIHQFEQKISKISNFYICNVRIKKFQVQSKT